MNDLAFALIRSDAMTRRTVLSALPDAPVVLDLPVVPARRLIRPRLVLSHALHRAGDVVAPACTPAA